MYFIMPLPYSQRARSIDVAYFLYSWRWAFRAVAGALMLAGVSSAWRAAGWRKLFVAFTLVAVAAVVVRDEFRHVGRPHLSSATVGRDATRRPEYRRAVAPRRRCRHQRRSPCLSRAVHRLSPSGARRRRRNARARELLHGVSHRTRVRARRRRRARDVSPRRHGSLQRDVRGSDDGQLVAPGDRRGDRRTAQGKIACRRFRVGR